MNVSGTATAVEIRDVCVSFGKLQALDNLSLNIPYGASFGLLGPNGAGKTTLIRVLAGLLRPSSGEVRIMGKAPSYQTALLTGYMPQLHSLYNELSVRQNIEFFASIYGLRGKRKKERVSEVIGLVDLWDRRKDSVQTLSGGMRQRVSLACAIVHGPRLLLLDEPTVGLDPELRVTFWNYFKRLTREGVTVVISSHTMDDAGHCDELVFIRQGNVIASGTPQYLKDFTGTPGATLEDAFLYCIRHGEKSHA
jgi:ABC-2 type transport system ATP-binding protein